jgi:anaerobic magnesium-protoporphyrin IX monomethyl ester cyclase
MLGNLYFKIIVLRQCNSYQRLDTLTDETLSLMYKAGCRMIHMGIESGSEKTRKVMNKFCSLGEITEKVKLIKKNGIKVGAWFMIGFPEETKEEMNKTIRYAFSLGSELVMFTICFPLPGTQVYRYIKEKYKFDRIDWANFDIYTSQYPVSKLSSMKLTWLLKGIRLRILLAKKIEYFKRILKKR